MEDITETVKPLFKQTGMEQVSLRLYQGRLEHLGLSAGIQVVKAELSEGRTVH